MQEHNHNAYLNNNFKDIFHENPHLLNLRERLRRDLDLFEKEPEAHGLTINSLKAYKEIYLKLSDHQRHLLDQMNQRAEFDEELIRKYLSLVDMEELKIRERSLEGK